DNVTHNFLYDDNGRLKETNLNGTAERVIYSDGPTGEVTATRADGGTTQVYFNADGNIAEAVDALGNTTHYFYDENHNRAKVIDAAGQVTTYLSDVNGNLSETTDPNGATTAFAHAGPFNRLTSYTDPNRNTTKYGYDSNGNLFAITYA